MKTIIAIVLAIILTGCGSLKKSVHKEATDSSSVVTATDKSTTTITEKADTTVKIKGDTAKASKPLDNLVKGDTLKAESNGTKVEVYFNPTTGRIHAQAITEPKEIPILIDRTTKVENDLRYQEEKEFHQEHKDVQVDRKETNLLNPYLWVVWLIFALVLLYLLWRFAPRFL